MINPYIQWLDVHAGAIQAVSAAIVAVLTFFLVIFTLKYVTAANEALQLAADQLKLVRDQVEQEKSAQELTREQFEREWEPGLRIAVVEQLDARRTHAKVANLAKPSALITAMRIGAGEGHQQNSVTYPRSDLVPGGDVRELEVLTELVRYRDQFYPITPVQGVTHPLKIVIRIVFTYDCGSGRQIDTSWYNFSVYFRDREILELVPRP
jgi:hypothetical protein